MLLIQISLILKTDSDKGTITNNMMIQGMGQALAGDQRLEGVTARL